VPRTATRAAAAPCPARRQEPRPRRAPHGDKSRGRAVPRTATRAAAAPWPARRQEEMGKKNRRRNAAKETKTEPNPLLSACNDVGAWIKGINETMAETDREYIVERLSEGRRYSYAFGEILNETMYGDQTSVSFEQATTLHVTCMGILNQLEENLAIVDRPPRLERKLARRLCAACGAAASLDGPALPCCDGCGGPRFCDEACQTEHWERGDPVPHKFLCLALSMKTSGRSPTHEEGCKIIDQVGEILDDDSSSRVREAVLASVPTEMTPLFEQEHFYSR